MADDDTTATDESDATPAGHRKKDAKRQKMLIIIGAVGVLVTVVLVIRSRNASASTTAAATNGIDPTTGLPYSTEENLASGLSNGVGGNGYIDPNTGVPYAFETPPSGGTSTTTTTNNNYYGSGGSAGSSTPGGGNSNAPSGSAINQLPATLQAALSKNNEYITDVQGGLHGDTLFLTDLGGVYDVGPGGSTGSDFFGSRFSLTPATQSGIRGTFNHLTVRPSGGYAITDTSGQTYNYGPK